ncbi:MAG: hypothetical protein ACLGIF_07960, partial [Actinomycetes bacterium]
MTPVAAPAAPRPRVRVAWPPPVDVALAAAFLALNSVEAVTGGGPRPLAVHLLVGGVAMVALAWRRRFPLVVALLVVAANVVVNPEGQFSPVLSLVLVAYSVGGYARPPQDLLGLTVLAGGMTIASVLGGLEPSDLAAVLVFVGGSWAVGRLVQQRSAHAAAAEARAARADEER